MRVLTWAEASSRIETCGLALRGIASLHPDEMVGSLRDARVVLLLGWIGAREWPAFAASPEASDGAPDPLDRWSRRVISALAEEIGAIAVFPSDGPPYRPFQQWAQRAEPVFPSPLGLLIHTVHGLWHSYRGALALTEPLQASPTPEAAPSPCASCADRPCLSTCPVGAFTEAGYDVDACARFLRTDEGSDCMRLGCRARRACPVAQVYSSEQAGFHMQAFLDARHRRYPAGDLP